MEEKGARYAVLAPLLGGSIMINLGKETRLKSDQVIEKAVAFFGPEGEGLQVEDRGAGCARFVGGGGFVFVSACDGEKRTQVDIESMEWEIQAKQFVASL
jgi:hypothetical protein